VFFLLVKAKRLFGTARAVAVASKYSMRV